MDYFCSLMLEMSECVSLSYQTQPGFWVRVQKVPASRQSDAWPMITPHAIDGNRVKRFGRHIFS
jgi:hypothetical protein